MNVYLDPSFVRAYKKLTAKNRRLQTKIKQKIAILQLDPKYPSLRLHKLTGFKRETWSVTITPDLRILFSYQEDGILLVDLGKHEEVY